MKTTKHWLIAGTALALGVAWTAGPALAQQTTGEKIDKKAERAADKTESTMDKVKHKTSELTDAAKDKTAEMKHKMDRANAAHDRQEVMVMQRSLREKGFNPGPEAGIVGPRTRAALKDYQKKEGLTPSGHWDDDTKSRLGVTAMTAPDKTAVSASPADPRGEKTTVNNPPPTKRNAP